MTELTDSFGDKHDAQQQQQHTEQQSQVQCSAESAQSQAIAQSPPSQIHRPSQARRPAQRASSSRQTAGKKNYMWSAQDIDRLVSVLYSNPSFQVALLPSRVSGPEEPTNKLNKIAVVRSIFKTVFPSSNHVDPERIKAKIRWLKDFYTKQKKKLSLTGAGFLEGMDASDPTYVSRAALAAKYPWFTKLNEMMSDRFVISPLTLLTTPSLDDDSDEDAITYGRDANEDDHSAHGRGLPPLGDLMQGALDPALVENTASSTAVDCQSVRSETPAPSLTPGASSGTPFQSTLSTPAANLPSSSPFTTTPTSAGKRKRGAAEQKKDAIADAYYRSQTENMQMRLQLEQEKTKREQMRVAVEQLKIQAETDSRNALRDQTAAMLRMQQEQSQMMAEMLRLLAGRNASSSTNFDQ